MKHTLLLTTAVALWFRAQAQAAVQPSPGALLSVQSSAKYIPPSELIVVDSEGEAVTKDLQRKVGPLVSGQKFQELDKLANDLRASKTQTADGTWHLKVLYEVLVGLPDTASEAEWQARLEFCRQWTRAMPDSITARVAWGTVHKNYAWHARGYGFANTVDNAGWKLFSARLRDAREILMAARNLEAKCPVWWDTMQFVALGLQWDLKSYDSLFNEAVAFEPNYAFFYFDKCMYLLPRWYGKEGDWQRFAFEASDKLGGEAGDILYARMGWRIHFRAFYDGFLRDAGYSWDRMRRGLELTVKKYPNSISAVSELAYLAYQAENQLEARRAFESLGNRVDHSVWDDDIDRFMRARLWALYMMNPQANPANPAAGMQPGQTRAGQTKGVVSRQPAGGQPSVPADAHNIVLKGISGTAAHRLAMINDQTLEKGETAKISVGGQKVNITCLDIKDRSAVIRVGGTAKPMEISLK